MDWNLPNPDSLIDESLSFAAQASQLKVAQCKIYEAMYALLDEKRLLQQQQADIQELMLEMDDKDRNLTEREDNILSRESKLLNTTQQHVFPHQDNSILYEEADTTRELKNQVKELKQQTQSIPALQKESNHKDSVIALLKQRVEDNERGFVDRKDDDVKIAELNKTLHEQDQVIRSLRKENETLTDKTVVIDGMRVSLDEGLKRESLLSQRLAAAEEETKFVSDEFNSIKFKLDAATKVNNVGQSKAHDDYNELLDRFNALQALYDSDKTTTRKQLHTQQNQHDVSLKAMREEVGDLESKLELLNQELNKSKQSHRNDLRQVHINYSQQRDEADRTHQDELDALRVSNDRDAHAQMRQVQKDLSDARIMLQNAEDSLQQNQAESARETKILKKRNDDLLNSVKDVQSRLDESAGANTLLESTIFGLKREQDHNVSRLKLNHEHEVQRLKQDLEDSLVSQGQKNSDDIVKLKSAHNGEVSRLKQQNSDLSALSSQAVDDITKLESELSLLKNQLKNSSSDNVVQTNKSKDELDGMHINLNSAQRELNNACMELLKCQTEMGVVQSDLARVKHELSASNDNNHKLQNDMRTLNDKALDLELNNSKLIDDLARSIQDSSRVREELNREREQRQLDHQRFDENLGDLHNLIQTNVSNNNIDKEKYITSINKLKDDVLSSSALLLSLNLELDELKLKYNLSLKQEEQSKLVIDELRSDNSSMSSQLLLSDDDIADLKRKLYVLSQDKSDLETRSDLTQSRLDNLQLKNSELIDETSVLMGTIKSKENEIVKLKQYYDKILTEADNISSHLQNKQHELHQREMKISQTESDCESLRSRADRLLKDGESKQNVLEQQEQVLVSKQNAFIARQSEFDHLLHDIAASETKLKLKQSELANREQTVNAKENQLRDAFATLDNNIESATKHITKEVEDRAKSLSSELELQIRVLKQQLDEQEDVAKSSVVMVGKMLPYFTKTQHKQELLDAMSALACYNGELSLLSIQTHTAGDNETALIDHYRRLAPVTNTVPNANKKPRLSRDMMQQLHSLLDQETKVTDDKIETILLDLDNTTGLVENMLASMNKLYNHNIKLSTECDVLLQKMKENNTYVQDTYKSLTQQKDTLEKDVNNKLYSISERESLVDQRSNDLNRLEKEKSEKNSAWVAQCEHALAVKQQELEQDITHRLELLQSQAVELESLRKSLEKESIVREHEAASTRQELEAKRVSLAQQYHDRVAELNQEHDVQQVEIKLLKQKLRDDAETLLHEADVVEKMKTGVQKQNQATLADLEKREDECMTARSLLEKDILLLNDKVSAMEKEAQNLQQYKQQLEQLSKSVNTHRSELEKSKQVFETEQAASLKQLQEKEEEFVTKVKASLNDREARIVEKTKTLNDLSTQVAKREDDVSLQLQQLVLREQGVKLQGEAFERGQVELNRRIVAFDAEKKQTLNEFSQKEHMLETRVNDRELELEALRMDLERKEISLSVLESEQNLEYTKKLRDTQNQFVTKANEIEMELNNTKAKMMNNKNEYNDNVKALCDEINSLKLDNTKLSGQTSELVLNNAKLSEENLIKADEIDEYKSTVGQYEDAVVKLQQSIASLQSKSNATVIELETSYKLALHQAEVESQQYMSTLVTSHNSQVEVMKREHRVEADSLRAQLRENEHMMKIKEIEMQYKLDSLYSKNNADMQAKSMMIEQEIHTKVGEFEAMYSKKMADLEAEYENKIAEIENNHNQNVVSIKLDHESHIKLIEADYDNQKAMLLHEVEQVKLAVDTEYNQVKADMVRQCESLEDNLAEVKSKFLQSQAELASLKTSSITVQEHETLTQLYLEKASAVAAELAEAKNALVTAKRVGDDASEIKHKAVAQAKLEFDAQVSDLEAHNAQMLYNIGLQHETDIAMLKQSHVDEINRLDSYVLQLKDEVKKCEVENDEKTAALAHQHKMEVIDFEHQISLFNQGKEMLEKSNDMLINEHRNMLGELSRLETSSVTARDELIRQHNDLLKAVHLQHENDIKILQDKLHIELEKVESEFEHKQHVETNRYDATLARSVDLAEVKLSILQDSYEKQLLELGKTLDVSEFTISELNSKVALLTTERDSLEKTVVSLDVQLNSLSVEFDTQRLDRERVDRETKDGNRVIMEKYNDVTAENSLISDKYNIVLAELTEQSSDVQTLRNDLQAANAEVKKLESRLAVEETHVNQLNEALERQRHYQTEFEKAPADHEDEQHAHEIQVLKSQVIDLQGKIIENQNTTHSYLLEIDHLNHVIADADARIASNQSLQDDSQAEISRLCFLLDECKDEMKTMYNSNTQLIQEVDFLKENNQLLGEENNELVSQIRTLEHTVIEQPAVVPEVQSNTKLTQDQETEAIVSAVDMGTDANTLFTQEDNVDRETYEIEIGNLSSELQTAIQHQAKLQDEKQTLVSTLNSTKLLISDFEKIIDESFNKENALKSELAELNQAYVALQDEVITLTNTVADAKSELKLFAQGEVNLREVEQDLRNQLNSAETIHEELVASRDELAAQLEIYRTASLVKSNDVSSDAGNSARLLKLELQLTEAIMTRNKLQGELDASKSREEQLVVRLQEVEKDQQFEDHNDVLDKMKNLENELSLMKSNLDTNYVPLGDYDKIVDLLNSANSDKIDLQLNHDDLHDRFNEVSLKYNETMTKYEELQNQSVLPNMILETKFDTLEQSYIALKSRYDDLEIVYVGLTGEYDALRQLQSRYEEQDERYYDLQDRYNALIDENDKLLTSYNEAILKNTDLQLVHEANLSEQDLIQDVVDIDQVVTEKQYIDDFVDDLTQSDTINDLDNVLFSEQVSNELIGHENVSDTVSTGHIDVQELQACDNVDEDDYYNRLILLQEKEAELSMINDNIQSEKSHLMNEKHKIKALQNILASQQHDLEKMRSEYMDKLQELEKERNSLNSKSFENAEELARSLLIDMKGKLEQDSVDKLQQSLVLIEKQQQERETAWIDEMERQRLELTSMKQEFNSQVDEDKILQEQREQDMLALSLRIHDESTRMQTRSQELAEFDASLVLREDEVATRMSSLHEAALRLQQEKEDLEEFSADNNDKRVLIDSQLEKTELVKAELQKRAELLTLQEQNIRLREEEYDDKLRFVDNECDHVRQQVASMQQRLQNGEEAYAEIKQRTQEAIIEQERVVQESTRTRLQEEILSAQRRRLEADLVTFQTEFERLSTSVNILKQQHVDVEDDITSLSTHKQEVMRVVDVLETERGAIKQDIVTLLYDCDVLRKQLEALNVQILMRQEQLGMLQHDRDLEANVDDTVASNAAGVQDDYYSNDYNAQDNEDIIGDVDHVDNVEYNDEYDYNESEEFADAYPNIEHENYDEHYDAVDNGEVDDEEVDMVINDIRSIFVNDSIRVDDIPFAYDLDSEVVPDAVDDNDLNASHNNLVREELATLISDLKNIRSELDDISESNSTLVADKDESVDVIAVVESREAATKQHPVLDTLTEKKVLTNYDMLLSELNKRLKADEEEDEDEEDEDDDHDSYYKKDNDDDNDGNDDDNDDNDDNGDDGHSDNNTHVQGLQRFVSPEVDSDVDKNQNNNQTTADNTNHDNSVLPYTSDDLKDEQEFPDIVSKEWLMNNNPTFNNTLSTISSMFGSEKVDLDFDDSPAKGVTESDMCGLDGVPLISDISQGHKVKDIKVDGLVIGCDMLTNKNDYLYDPVQQKFTGVYDALRSSITGHRDLSEGTQPQVDTTNAIVSLSNKMNSNSRKFSPASSFSSSSSFIHPSFEDPYISQLKRANEIDSIYATTSAYINDEETVMNADVAYPDNFSSTASTTLSAIERAEKMRKYVESYSKSNRDQDARELSQYQQHEVQQPELQLISPNEGVGSALYYESDNHDDIEEEEEDVADDLSVHKLDGIHAANYQSLKSNNSDHVFKTQTQQLEGNDKDVGQNASFSIVPKANVVAFHGVDEYGYSSMGSEMAHINNETQPKLSRNTDVISRVADNVNMQSFKSNNSDHIFNLQSQKPGDLHAHASFKSEVSEASAMNSIVAFHGTHDLGFISMGSEMAEATTQPKTKMNSIIYPSHLEDNDDEDLDKVTSANYTNPDNLKSFGTDYSDHVFKSHEMGSSTSSFAASPKQNNTVVFHTSGFSSMGSEMASILVPIKEAQSDRVNTSVSVSADNTVNIDSGASMSSSIFHYNPSVAPSESVHTQPQAAQRLMQTLANKNEAGITFHDGRDDTSASSSFMTLPHQLIQQQSTVNVSRQREPKQLSAFDESDLTTLSSVTSISDMKWTNIQQELKDQERKLWIEKIQQSIQAAKDKNELEHEEHEALLANLYNKADEMIDLRRQFIQNSKTNDSKPVEKSNINDNDITKLNFDIQLPDEYFLDVTNDMKELMREKLYIQVMDNLVAQGIDPYESDDSDYEDADGSADPAYAEFRQRDKRIRLLYKAPVYDPNAPRKSKYALDDVESIPTNFFVADAKGDVDRMVNEWDGLVEDVIKHAAKYAEENTIIEENIQDNEKIVNPALSSFSSHIVYDSDLKSETTSQSGDQDRINDHLKHVVNIYNDSASSFASSSLSHIAYNPDLKSEAASNAGDEDRINTILNNVVNIHNDNISSFSPSSSSHIVYDSDAKSDTATSAGDRVNPLLKNVVNIHNDSTSSFNSSSSAYLDSQDDMIRKLIDKYQQDKRVPLQLATTKNDPPATIFEGLPSKDVESVYHYHYNPSVATTSMDTDKIKKYMAAYNVEERNTYPADTQFIKIQYEGTDVESNNRDFAEGPKSSVNIKPHSPRNTNLDVDLISPRSAYEHNMNMYEKEHLNPNNVIITPRTQQKMNQLSSSSFHNISPRPVMVSPVKKPNLQSAALDDDEDYIGDEYNQLQFTYDVEDQEPEAVGAKSFDLRYLNQSFGDLEALEEQDNEHAGVE